MKLGLTDGTSMTFVDGQSAMLSEGRRALFELNDIAGYIGCRLEEGIGLSELIAEIGARDLPPDAAAATVRRLVVEWSRAGFVQALDGPAPAPVVQAQDISVAGLPVRLTHRDEALAMLVAPCFAHLGTSPAAPSLAYDLWRAERFALVGRHGEPAAVLTPAEVAPWIKARLTEAVLADRRWPLAVHAGCVQWERQTMLLVGRPGAGKTTLTSWLLYLGFGYGGDDVTLLDDDGRAQGLPFLPSLKAGAWPLIGRTIPDLSRLPVHRRPDGRRVRYPRPRRFADSQPATVDRIVLLRREKGRPAQLAPVAPKLVLQRLVAEAVSASGTIGRRMLDVLIRMVGAAPAHELRYADAADAARLLRATCVRAPD